MTTESINSASANPDKLELQAVIGFKGDVPNGVILHPDNEHLIYPLGSTVVIRNVIKRTQVFLRGHSDEISALELSRCGRFLASGQKTHMGFSADVIVWDFQKREALHRLRLHKVSIQSISFSEGNQYLVTLGGQDDNSIVLWDLATGEAICGTTAANDVAKCIKFFHSSPYHFVSCGNYHAKIWTIDIPNKKLRSIDCKMANVSRICTSLDIDKSDSKICIGTTTGDILEGHIILQSTTTPCPQEVPAGKRTSSLPSNATATPQCPSSHCSPKTISSCILTASSNKRLLSMGITAIQYLSNGDILIGSGYGVIARLSASSHQIVAKTSVLGSITSIVLCENEENFFLATNHSNLYWGTTQSLSCELRNSCHSSRINQIVFPASCSQVFATCSLQDIRIWNSQTRNELLRIQVPNVECLCIAFAYNGSFIISGWSDGNVRAFLPQSGRLLYTINDVHKGGVSSLIIGRDDNEIITGGINGDIRVWKISKSTQILVASLKEHRGRVNQIKLRPQMQQVLSCSSDGSIILWNLGTFTRSLCLFESTLFNAISCFPDGSQLLSVSNDRKITLWDLYDGSTIRAMSSMDAVGKEGELHCVDIATNGEYFVTGGETKDLLLWDYNSAQLKAVGIGHAGSIKACAISPDQSFIVSAGEDAAILIWKAPQ